MEAEFFHLILDRASSKDLKGIDAKSLEGFHTVCTLVSLKAILGDMLQNNPNESKTILLSKLIRKLDECLDFDRKLYILSILINSNTTWGDSSVYYKSLVEIQPLLEKQKVQGQLTGEEEKQLQEFYDYFNLSKKTIPLRVILNNLCFEFLAKIKELAYGDSTAFMLGTQSHTIAVQIERHYPSEKFPEGELIYSIFNTGWRVELYHLCQGKGSNSQAKPLKIKGLCLKDFTFDFASEVLKIFFEKNGCKKFYKLHKKYFKTGVFKKDEGKWYFLQKRGTCSFIAPQVWILSYMNESEEREFVQQKVCRSVDRQAELVFQLKENNQSNKKSTETNNKKRKRTELEKDPEVEKVEPSPKKLRHSLNLLNLGKKIKERVLSIDSDKFIFF